MITRSGFFKTLATAASAMFLGFVRPEHPAELAATGRQTRSFDLHINHDTGEWNAVARDESGIVYQGCLNNIYENFG